MQGGTAKLVGATDIQLVVASSGGCAIEFHEVITLGGERDVAARQNSRTAARSNASEHLQVANHAAAHERGCAIDRDRALRLRAVHYQRAGTHRCLAGVSVVAT